MRACPFLGEFQYSKLNLTKNSYDFFFHFPAYMFIRLKYFILLEVNQGAEYSFLEKRCYTTFLRKTLWLICGKSQRLRFFKFRFSQQYMLQEE